MFRFKVALIVGFASLALPAFAAGPIHDHIDLLMTESATLFQKDDYFGGVDKVTQACLLLKSNPSEMPDTTYSTYAAGIVDAIKTKIKSDHGDVPSVTRHSYALQRFLNLLSNWEPQNPRWHYENGLVYRELSATQNDEYPIQLKYAIQQFEQALAIGGGGQYREDAQRMLTVCEQKLQIREAEVANHHPSRGGQSNMPAPEPRERASIICVFCGHSHLVGFTCPYCGH